MLVQIAKQARADRKKPKGKALNKTGGLKRLLPSEERSLTPDEELDDYLKREGVEAGSSASTNMREDSHQAMELQRMRLEMEMSRREEDAKRSRVRRARNNLMKWLGGGGREEEEEPQMDPGRASRFSTSAAGGRVSTRLLEKSRKRRSTLVTQAF